ncbi:MAG: Asp-tRNA(Asn)/Glu-tRNA(Gln) amidotransferase subunit GatA [Verrucomicrobiales bacterium]
MSDSAANLSITELQHEYRSGNRTPVEALTDVIEAIETKDSDVGAYLSLDSGTALRDAEKADVSLPLGGIPIAIKDLINVKGQPCSCASRFLHSAYTSTYDATVISRLRKAGAIPLGRTNMDEFAMGSSTENSGIQLSRNPWDTERVPGGSSGGSAIAVANNTAIAALGSDTGGSIRQPASFCGSVGLKPTYGRVSRFGLVAFASSLDQIGPMTKSSEDAALLLSIISGDDPLDSTAISDAVPDYLSDLNGDIKGLRIGLPEEYFTDGIDPGVRQCVENAVGHLEKLGAKVIEVSLPHTEYAIATYYIIATAEASANLARFDGVRYGNRAPDPDDIIDHYRRSRAAGFGDEVKRRIILGTYVLSSGYNDAYYVRAQKVRTLIRQDFSAAFEQADVLVSPTAPTPAFKIGEKSGDPLQMYLADIFTIAANLAGICGASTPCGLVQSETGTQLPVGLQVLGPPLGEGTVLRVTDAFEKTTDWHRRQPC